MMSFMEQVQNLQIPLQEILLATNNFDEQNYIGRGGFGRVYRGVLSRSELQTTVAIKRLDSTGGQGEREFMMEIAMLSSYRYENLVSLVGFCDERGEKILVYEYASNGSLDKFLRSKDLSWKQRLRICLDAARGLKYLHHDAGPQHRVMHRDIKSSNILLDENWRAKISDFGLSKIGPANLQFTFLISNACGTLGYVDPQYMKTGILTKESDVFSFGVVLFEVLCGRLACIEYDDERRFLFKLAQQHYKLETLEEIIDPNLWTQTHSTSLRAFTTIAHRCLKKHREERPSMSLVVEALEQALDFQEGVEKSSPTLDNLLAPKPHGRKLSSSSSQMDDLFGLLRVRIKRGVNLAVRDINTSDPYVIIKMGRQKLKTRVVKKNVNPEWNEDFTLLVQDPDIPVKLTVYDYDTFTIDEKMGDAEFEIKSLLEARKMPLRSLERSTIITKVQPSRENCLAEESYIIWRDFRVVQDLCLRLRNVECGKVELELHWIDIPGSKSI